MSKSNYQPRRAGTAAGLMPGGQMLAQGTDDMPKVDMNAAVATAAAEGVMPDGKMAATAAEGMPSGAMGEGADATGQAQEDMPLGGMLSDAGFGMPSGSMLSAASGSEAWNMDVSAAQPCGCS